MRSQRRNVAVALLLVAASFVLAYGPVALACCSLSGDSWFVVRWRVNRSTLPKGFVLQKGSIQRRANRECVVQRFPGVSLLWRPLQQLDLAIDLASFERGQRSGDGRPNNVTLPQPERASFEVHCDRQRIAARGRIVSRRDPLDAQPGHEAGSVRLPRSQPVLWGARAELDTAPLDALVIAQRSIGGRWDHDLYLSLRDGPRFCLVSVAPSQLTDGTDSAVTFTGSRMLSVKDLLRHATWNRSNDDFSGEFVLLVDCYSSHQHIDATSRYALNRDYDTRAYARSVEACNQLEGQR